MKAFNLLVAFALEICLLIVFGYWGFHVGTNTAVHWLLGLLIPLLTALAWGLVAAPRAKRRLPRVPRLVFAVLLFSLGSLALWSVGKHEVALIFEAIMLVSQTLGYIWKQ